MNKPYTLRIETERNVGFSSSYHLGTNLCLAMTLAEERFTARIKAGMPTVSVALLRDGKMLGCFDGDWTRTAK